MIRLLLALPLPAFALALLPGQPLRLALAAWLLAASTAAFGLYAWDKRRARQGGRRVRERRLHLLAAIGGWPGALAAQELLRHKTAKRAFQVTTWSIVLAYQALAIFWIAERLTTRGWAPLNRPEASETAPSGR